MVFISPWRRASRNIDRLGILFNNVGFFNLLACVGDEFLEHILASFLAQSQRVYFFGEIRCVIICAQAVIHHSWRSSLQM